jgi:hypothetical protein
LPRKYHRPPATKRRKPRKASPYTFGGAPEPNETDDTELAASAEELDDEEDWPGEARVAAAPEETRQKGRAVQHLVSQQPRSRPSWRWAFIIVSLLIGAPA